MTDDRNQSVQNNYDQLSLKDLLDARDLYHVHLMEHANVVATAIGRYRIHITDSWPDHAGPGKRHGTGERTLENSEVRPYSWPSVLVFVQEWVESSKFSQGGTYDPDQMVPKTLYLADGRRVPVCVVRAPRQLETPATAPSVRYPLNNLGGGFPVLANLQGREHVATIACLVSDGHKIYAVTNRHVTGEPGEILYSRLGGKIERIGVSAPKQLTRVLFTELYPGFAGRNVYVNLDVGLIEVDDVSRWTAQIRDVGIMGSMLDLSADNFSLRLIDRPVRGYGSTSKVMLGQISALFYRYKSQGGFEYVSDFLIGPRSESRTGKSSRRPKEPAFATHPGDSGTLWLLEQSDQKQKTVGNQGQPQLIPLAVEWGSHLLDSSGSGRTQSFALATCLSTVCSLLNVDPVRDWNLDQPDTWGSVGHFAIASRVTSALSSRVPKLTQLMTNNLKIISHDDATILNSEFKNMGEDAFVPLADVPDFFWKHGKQGFSRGNEGPNHFADMDQKRLEDGADLLTLCEDKANVVPEKWDAFYDSVNDILTGDPIEQKHRGLLPFRVRQIFDEMVGFAKVGKTAEFVCAAGVLTHYVGDACQPLHISFLHDGDPQQPVTRTVHHRNGTEEEVKDPLGKGVHSAYEDEMVNANRQKILDELGMTPKTTGAELINDGLEAAVKTIELMRKTFGRIPPANIVDAFVRFGKSKVGRADSFWKQFGKATIQCMQDGTHLLGVLWESAWKIGDGNRNLDEILTLTEDQAMKICADRNFLPSCTINEIGKLIRE
jgi:hypothetical protein